MICKERADERSQHDSGQDRKDGEDVNWRMVEEVKLEKPDNVASDEDK